MEPWEQLAGTASVWGGPEKKEACAGESDSVQLRRSWHPCFVSPLFFSWLDWIESTYITVRIRLQLLL